MTAFIALACPHCGRTNDAHDGPPDTPPVDGDVSICWGCRQLGIYADTPTGLTIGKPSPDEARELAADPDIRAALAAAAESYTPAQAADLRYGAHR